MESTAELVPRQSEVVSRLQQTWPEPQRIEWGMDPVWPENHPLAAQFEALAKGAPCSLPHISKNRINWVTFGGSHLELFEAIEDLRAWVFPNFGKEDIPALVSAETAR